MQQTKDCRYQLEQDNRIYILTTSLLPNKIRIICKDSDSQTFFGIFTMNDLIKISKYFQPNHTVEQIHKYLNGIIEKQRVSILSSGNVLHLMLHLINNDNIIIPLSRYNPNQNVNMSYQNISPQSNIQQSNNMTIPQANITQNYINPIPSQPRAYEDKTYAYRNVNSGNIPFKRSISNQVLVGTNNISSFTKLDSNTNNYNLEDKKISKLEGDTNIIRAEQEKLKNDMKKVLEEAQRLKAENEMYKTNTQKLMGENNFLKNELEKLKNQIQTINLKGNKDLQEENDALRNQVNSLSNDIEAVDNQNNQIRKMYEDLEAESNNYRQQTEEVYKENELLKNQIEELNNNYITINEEIENIKKENLDLKNNMEAPKENINEEMVQKLMQENELLKKKNEELSYQIQVMQEGQDEEGQDDDGQEKEVKGDIIQDMKELDMITKKINKDNNKKIIINLLYKASVDGDRASDFHNKCDKANSSIVLVETKQGKRFGGYTTCSWEGNGVEKNDSNAFIFSFDKMQTYDNIPGDEAIGCYPKFGPIFLGCQIKIFDNAFTKGGTTFERELNYNTKEDYELNDGEREFQIKDIEVYEVILE